jgi:hypothetical protein
MLLQTHYFSITKTNIINPVLGMLVDYSESYMETHKHILHENYRVC